MSWSHSRISLSETSIFMTHFCHLASLDAMKQTHAQASSSITSTPTAGGNISASPISLKTSTVPYLIQAQYLPTSRPMEIVTLVTMTWSRSFRWFSITSRCFSRRSKMHRWTATTEISGMLVQNWNGLLPNSANSTHPSQATEVSLTSKNSILFYSNSFL